MTFKSLDTHLTEINILLNHEDMAKDKCEFCPETTSIIMIFEEFEYYH